MDLRYGSCGLGFLILVILAGATALLGFPRSVDELSSFGLVFVAGLLLLSAGFDTILVYEVKWYQITGSGYVLMGMSFLMYGISGEIETFYAISTIVLSLSLGYVGFDIARGGYLTDGNSFILP